MNQCNEAPTLLSTRPWKQLTRDSIFSIFQYKNLLFHIIEYIEFCLSLSFFEISALFSLAKSFSCLSIPCNHSINSKFPLHVIMACLILVFFLLKSLAYFLFLLMVTQTVCFPGKTFPSSSQNKLLAPVHHLIYFL